jgi:uncharacterized membrane protein
MTRTEREVLETVLQFARAAEALSVAEDAGDVPPNTARDAFDRIFSRLECRALDLLAERREIIRRRSAAVIARGGMDALELTRELAEELGDR